ncbi:MAG: B12-binding domain-containing radical SAM protein [Candidatus Thorarchaeota archaeon]
MSKIVLTTDASNMSELHQNIYLGFLSCLPKNVCPEPMYKALVPPVDINPDGSARLPTLPLRAVEAICVNAGHDPKDVKVAHPLCPERVIGKDTKIVGISTHDPLGLGPATSTWASILNGIPHNRLKFLDLMRRVRSLKEKYGFTTVLGGSGFWQVNKLDTMDELGIDCIVVGEGETSVPKLFEDILNETDSDSRIVTGRIPEPEEIPPVLGPSNCKLVEITRGCGRGCAFCSPDVSGRLRSLPIEKIVNDVRVHAEAGFPRVIFQSDDALRYGSSTLMADKDALLNLYKESFKTGIKEIFITHASLVTFAQQPDVIEALTKLLNKRGVKYYGCQPGLETGSFRLLARHMQGKMYPRDSEEWHDVVYEAMMVMKQNKWFAVCTLICGLPEENVEDVDMTIDLIKRLESFPSLYIPLFFVPMSLTKLEDRTAFVVENMTKEHWRLIYACWEHNLAHIYKLYKMTMANKHTVLSVLVKSLASTLKVWMNIKREEYTQPT